MSVFQDALAQAEANHKRELEQLRQVFQTELAFLKEQLSLHQYSPKANISLETKLDLIMQHLHLAVPSIPDSSQTPSPPRKRRDQTPTPDHLKQSNSEAMEEEQFPETTLNWDSDDEEKDKYSSSHDNDMTLSGRED